MRRRRCVRFGGGADGGRRGAAVVDVTGAHVLGHVVLGGFLGVGAAPVGREVAEDFGVCHGLGGEVFCAAVADVELDRRAVDIHVHAFAVPGGRGVDGLARGLLVGEHEGAVDRESLGGVHGHGVAVIEADLAVPVADLVVEELHDPAAVGTASDPQAGLAGVRDQGGMLADVEDLEVGSVEEALAEVGGAGAERVADRDLEGFRLCLGSSAAARQDDVAGTVVVPQHALAHEVREGAYLDLGMGDDRGGLVGLLGADAVPVVDDAGRACGRGLSPCGCGRVRDRRRSRRPRCRRGNPRRRGPAGLDVALAVVRELVEIPGDRGELFRRCGGGCLAGAGPGYVVRATSMSSTSCFWRRIVSTRVLPATSRMRRRPGPASTAAVAGCRRRR